jgi:hypothetical protein
LNKSPHIVFQQKFSSSPGKPEREFGFLPRKMIKNKYRHYLNLSYNLLCGGFGEVDMINKLFTRLKNQQP